MTSKSATEGMFSRPSHLQGKIPGKELPKESSDYVQCCYSGLLIHGRVYFCATASTYMAPFKEGNVSSCVVSVRTDNAPSLKP